MKGAGLCVTVVCVAVMVSVTLAEGPGDDPANIVGTKACAICHKKDESGNQLAKWQAGPHAKAFEVLASDKAKAPAEKLGVAEPQKSPKCLRCHSSAYWFSEEVKTEKIKVEEGVSCESCHGAGKKYFGKTVMKDRQKCIENGMVYPATKSCVKCHNETNPTYNPERYTTKDGKKVDFDPEQAWEKIKHPDPRVKKE